MHARTPTHHRDLPYATHSGEDGAVNPAQQGTKTAPVFRRDVAPGQPFTVWVRLSNVKHEAPFDDFASVLATRIAEADEFYSHVQVFDWLRRNARAHPHELTSSLSSPRCGRIRRSR